MLFPIVSELLILTSMWYVYCGFHYHCGGGGLCVEEGWGGAGGWEAGGEEGSFNQRESRGEFSLSSVSLPCSD